MIHKRLLDVPILYLSSYIISNKDNYYETLNGVTTRRNWHDWILYMMKAIEETSLFTIQKITEIDRLYRRTLELAGLKLPHNPTEVIERIFEQPYTSPKKLLDQNNLFRSTGIRSLNTAKKYLKQLEDLKILVPQKIGKEVIYLNIDLFNLLSET